MIKGLEGLGDYSQKLVFVDIEGAFNNANIKSIINALAKKPKPRRKDYMNSSGKKITFLVCLLSKIYKRPHYGMDKSE